MKKDTNSGAFRFKIGNLARQDAISYADDKYGSVAKLSQRKSKIEDYKGIAKYGNETIFKHGLSLLDDLDEIVVSTEAERKRVLKVFGDNKVSHLNDGRKVEDVVRVNK
jgi:hypothetical protein